MKRKIPEYIIDESHDGITNEGNFDQENSNEDNNLNIKCFL